MNTAVNDSSAQIQMPHEAPHPKLFPGSLPKHCLCRRWWRENTAHVKHVSKNQTPKPVKRNLLHLQKFGKFLCTLRAAEKRCHSSGFAFPPPWQKDSGETRSCSSPGNSNCVKPGSVRMTTMVNLGCPWQPLTDRWDDEMRGPEIGLSATICPPEPALCSGHYPPPTLLLCLTPQSDSSLCTTRKG